MKNTDIIITNCALIKQKKAKITCLRDFCFLFFFCFLLFAISRRLRSHFKNSCFVFYRGFQTLENNKSPRPNGLGFSSVFSCLETSVKHSHSFLKYYLTLKNQFHEKKADELNEKLSVNFLFQRSTACCRKQEVAWKLNLPL